MAGPLELVWQPQLRPRSRERSGLHKLDMGACGSSPSGEDEQQKKRSAAIDKTLEEDSKKLRKECKILLLGG